MMMFKHNVLIALLIIGVILMPQLSYGQLLAWDDYEADLGGATELEIGVDGFAPETGAGWDGSFSQNGTTDAVITNVTPLVSTLTSTTQYLSVPKKWGGCRRSLNTDDAGPFAAYKDPGIFGGGIGQQTGGTLWFSCIARPTSASDIEIRFKHQNTADKKTQIIVDCSAGGNFSLTGDALSAEAESSVPVADDGTTYIIVLKIQFGATATTVDMFIDPDDLGGTNPGTADVTATTDYAIQFDQLEFSQGDFDEPRFAATYAAVTPAQALSDDATLSDLTVSGSTVDGFDAATLTYNVELPYGTSEVPTVGYTLNDDNADAAQSDATSLPGATTVVVTAEDGSTMKTYTINFTIATAINELLDLNVSVYPNPVVDRLQISAETARIQQVDVLNLNGQKIISRQVDNISSYQLDVSQLATGCYVLAIKTDKQLVKQQLIVR